MNGLFCKSSPEFQYMNRGAMASMGMGGGVTDLKRTNLPAPKTTLSGRVAYLVWSSTYLTKQLSIQNMILIPMYWFKALVFGRDISKF
jgi:NADH dehydrogenase FAD-containing subunit